MKYSYRKKSYKLQHKLKIFLAILLAALISTTGYIISNNTFSKKDNYINYFNEKTEDGINVVVDAKPNTIPKNSTLEIEKITDESEEAIKESINEVKGNKVNIAKSYTYDICILDKNGNEIEPNDNVRISFQSNEISNSNLDTKIYHTTTDEDNTIEKTEKLKGRINKDVITATTDSFSYYTVAFTYNDKTYNLGGDEEVKLEKILNVLELTGKVTNVESSNNELFYPELREDGYYIVSIAPFETEEYLNVTIDGIVYKIDVTDATYTCTFGFLESGDSDPDNTNWIGNTIFTYTIQDNPATYVVTLTKIEYHNTTTRNIATAGNSFFGFGNGIRVSVSGTKIGEYNLGTVNAGQKKTVWSGSKTVTINKTHETQQAGYNLMNSDTINICQVELDMADSSLHLTIPAKTSYSVSYNANGGSGAPGSQTKWYGENLTLSSTQPTRTGYTFAGWNTNSSGTGTNYAAGATYTGNAALSLYAKWTAKSYTLTWNLAGGKKASDAGPINYTVTYGEQTSNARDLPIKTGYVCTGMYDSSNNKVFDENGHCTTNGGYWTATYANGGRWKYDGNLTVTAKYTANTYTIGYTLNGGDNPSTKPTSGTYDQDVQISNPTKTVTVTGNANNTGATVGAAQSKAQTFSGWTSTTLGSNAKTGTAANPTTAWTGSSTKNTYFRNLRESGTATMVANWTPVAVTLPTLSKTGYTCKWYTDATAGSLMGAGGASWTPGANSAAAVTAYARCTENTATLTYANGGHGTAPSNVTMKYSAATNAAAALSATGYNFTGWKRSDTGAVIAAGAQVKAANVNPTALTLTAQWSEKTATLTYNNGGHGTAPANATMKYTTATNAASAISAAGYAFAGWKRSDTSAVIAAGAQVKAANVEPTALTLTAQWTPYKLTLKYHVNGGTITTDTSQATRWRANSSLVQRSTDSGATWADITAVINTDTTTADLWNVGTYNAKKTGYSISGTKAYNTKADGTGVNINQDHNASSSPDNAPTVARINGGALTADKTMNIYVNWVPNTYTIGYTLNGGTNGTNGPTSGTYDTDVQISNPTKTVTVTGNVNNTGATIGAAQSKAQTFSGWTSTTLGSNAKTGTAANPTTAWTGSSTKNTYFRNLRES